jgi:hypothetical protein
MKSSTAIFAAVMDPWPPRSEYTPDISVNTPIRTTLSDMPVCARAGIEATANVTVQAHSIDAANVVFFNFCLLVLAFLSNG